MLDAHHLERHDGVDAGSAVVLAIQRLDYLVQVGEIHGAVDLTKQVVTRHEEFYPHISIGSLPIFPRSSIAIAS